MKRSLSALLALCLLTLSLTACGNAKTPPDSSGAASESSGAAGTEAASTPETAGAESADSDSSQAATTAGSQATRGTTAATTSGKGTAAFDIKTAPMPTRELTNKKITYFAWNDITKNNGKADPKSMAALFKKEFGVEFEWKPGTHETYWNTLATLKGSGQAPDLVMLPDWNFYPIAIVDKMLQPLDSYIDFNNPLWADSKENREKFRWNGKAYVAFFTPVVDCWLFYNKKMFKDNGVKTPRELYLADNWTWDTMRDTANQFVHKAANGKVDTWGLGFQHAELLSTIGMELVEPDAKAGYQFHMKDPRLAKMMNMLYDMGGAGTGALGLNDQPNGSLISRFNKGKMAMLVTMPWAANVDCNEMRLAGNLDWVPLPKMDKKSSHYLQVSTSPGWGICEGAKNPQAAAAVIEFSKWLGLGDPICTYLPQAENAARIKYKTTVSKVTDPKAEFTKEEIAWTKQILDKNYPTVSNLWQSWLNTQELPGYAETVSGSKKWSAALEEVYPVNEALLKLYFKKK